MDKENFLRALAESTKTFIVEQLAPLRERLIIDGDRMDAMEARIAELEAKGEPAKLYDVKPRIRANVG